MQDAGVTELVLLLSSAQHVGGVGHAPGGLAWIAALHVAVIDRMCNGCYLLLISRE